MTTLRWIRDGVGRPAPSGIVVIGLPGVDGHATVEVLTIDTGDASRDEGVSDEAVDAVVIGEPDEVGRVLDGAMTLAGFMRSGRGRIETNIAVLSFLTGCVEGLDLELL